MELSLQLKIKDNVDHAGLSQPQELLKESTRLNMDLFHLFLSNNSLTALSVWETTAAMVDGPQLLCNTLSQPQLNMNQLIHIKQ